MSHLFVPPPPDPNRRWAEWCQHPVDGGVCNQERDHAAHWPRAQVERVGEFHVCAYPVPKTGSAWRSFFRRDRARSAVDAGQVVVSVRDPQRETEGLAHALVRGGTTIAWWVER